MYTYIMSYQGCNTTHVTCMLYDVVLLYSDSRYT